MQGCILVFTENSKRPMKTIHGARLYNQSIAESLQGSSMGCIRKTGKAGISLLIVGPNLSKLNYVNEDNTYVVKNWILINDSEIEADGKAIC